jgi:hypothetical protein
MPFHRGMSSSVALLPAVTTSAVQQFNQDRASFVCSVSANDYLTTVSFQYNTTNNWSSYSTVSAGTTVGTNQTMYYNITGLSVGTTYYVRAVAVSNVGTVIGSVVSFTTWSLKTYLNTTAGSFSVSVPSITPLGSSALAPTIYEMLVYGGGGGANYAGGGGGGYRIAASKVSSASGTQSVSGTVGAGGGAGNGGGGTGGAGSGGSSTLTIGDTTYTATGGGAGAHPGSIGAPSGTGGASGSGDNTSKAGGGNSYGYYYFTGSYVQVVVGYNNYCCATDKFGNCTQYCPDYNSPIYGNDPNQPIYAWSGSYYAGGGGGGTDAAGAGASGQGSASHVGGAGGTGGGAYGLRGGNGGGGGGTQGTGANGGVAGSGPIAGTGGQGWFGAGVAGGITFKYYGP